MNGSVLFNCAAIVSLANSRSISLIAGTDGQHEPSRALMLASKKWPDSRKGRSVSPANLSGLSGEGERVFTLQGKLAELAYRPSREIAVSLLNHHRAGGFDLANHRRSARSVKFDLSTFENRLTRERRVGTPLETEATDITAAQELGCRT
jgi:hypothetical protein